MVQIKLSDNDIKFLSLNYPSFKIFEGKINGDLFFDLTYKGVRIKDKYSIEIILKTKEESILPTVRETNGKILRIVNRKKIRREKLHLNNNEGELCLIIPPKEKMRYQNGFEIKEFMKHIEEHLYWASYYDRYNKPPWKEQAHGINGYLELYDEDISFRPNTKEALEKKYNRTFNRREIRNRVKNNRKNK
ncbi:MAG: hypothetical protein KAT68_12005 [Bacteroidales bacterium]|nr:hypothetical protein [Bacteroidales bacterium]